jgi:ketosteroid isomerase-like protein
MEAEMGVEDNIKTIKAVYEAFGRGDVGTILDALSDDVDWASEASTTGAPWYRPRRGKAEVGSFFEAFGSTMEVQEFTPLSFAGNDEGEVHTVVRCRATSRATGRAMDQNLHHFFRFNGGQITYYRGSEDTAQVEAALRP